MTISMRTQKFLLAVAMVTSVTTLSALADEARLETFAAEDGRSYFAMTVPPIEARNGGPRDVVVLVDTSASQAGYFRDTAIAALEQCIAGLNADDRVQVVAVDLAARAMNESLVTPKDASVAEAVAAVRREPPLGSTDMELALNSATEMFDVTSDRERTIVYIGDGMSPANLFQTESFSKLVTGLRAAGVSVNSFAVGPERDLELLMALGSQTGGNVYVDTEMTWPNEAEGITAARAMEENRRRGGTVGKALAEWVHADVVQPTETELPAAIAVAYPAQLLPMRSDRESVLIGELAADAKIDQASMTASVDGKPMTWTVVDTAPQSDLSFLPQLVEIAERDGGVALTTLGSRGLQETGRVLLSSVDELTDLAERALSIGDREGAGRIVEAVLRRDPGNLRAQTVQTLVERGEIPAPAAATNNAAAAPPTSGDLNLVRVAQAGEVVPPPNPAGVTVVGPESGDFIEGIPARDAVVDGSFLTEVERQNRVVSEMLEKEVEVSLSQARDNMRSNPDRAAQDLKLMMENVRRAPQLIPEVRAQLIDRLQTVLQETARAATVDAELRLEAEERAAAARELQLLNDRLSRKVEQEKQLVARMNALMDEHRYSEAQELAQILYEVDPDGVTPVVAELHSRFEASHYLQEITRERRHRQSWETWFQVELSGVPQPDEPPIVYPSAEVWEELTNRREKYKAVDLAGQDGAEQRINKALSDPLNNIGLEFQDTPLSEVVDFLRTDYNIEVQLDLKALDDLGLSPDDPISVNLRNISLRSALRIMLKQLDLTYVISDEVLLITSEEEALTQLQVKVYPVADLVLPIQTPQGGGMMGGGGGMMGGGGGMMGGGGGMMGGGGGMMGGGGGMMGGGGGGMFSVPETDTPSDKPAAPAAPVAPQPEPAASEPAASEPAKASTKLVIDESISPELFWDGHFGASIRDTAEVRGMVRNLMNEGRYDQVTALIQAALRHGQPQPWMYEALGIAMQMDGREKAEIERVIMSAADFSRSPDQLTYIAQYLSRLGYDARALQLYQQVVKMDPLRSEAYALGMRAAERANDAAGIRWATVGVLEQAWPANQEVVAETAWRVAKATIESMAKAGQKDEANAYKEEIRKAIERDCVIRVSWTGDADVDLVVEEPGGSICSAADPRAAGGGVNMGDVFTGVKGDNTGVLSETYVCPRGFAGSYRAKITPMWGKVTAGKVTVDVFQHFNSDNVEHKTQVLELKGDGAQVEFNLADGRRTEPLEMQHVARAVERQAAVSRAVLAQQLAGVSDPGSIPDRLRDPRNARLRRQLLAGGGGAVGFQPVVIALPEGTNFMATGVVSADRRYVRITSVPFFSTIGEVATFTFAGASTPVDDDDDGGDNGGDNGGNNGGGAAN